MRKVVLISLIFVLLLPSVVADENRESQRLGEFWFLGGNNDKDGDEEKEIEPSPDYVMDLTILRFFAFTTVSIVLIALFLQKSNKKNKSLRFHCV